MPFKIPCETYLRFVNAAIPVADSPDRPNLVCVRLERYRGKLFAVATNSCILAVENLGTDEGPDAGVSIVITPELIQQCQIEKAEGELFIEPMPGVSWSIGKTSSGWLYGANAAMYTPYADWRSIILFKPSEEPHGFIYTVAETLSALGRTSPSGRFTFPKIIDTRQPLIVRDCIDSAWFGVFLAVSSDHSRNFSAATYPDWIV